MDFRKGLFTAHFCVLPGLFYSQLIYSTEKAPDWESVSLLKDDFLPLFISQFLDHLLTGIEDICGHYGHHHWKDK